MHLPLLVAISQSATDNLLHVALHRCTFWLCVAGFFAVSAVYSAGAKRNARMAICWLAISWQMAIVDAGIWMLKSFRNLGTPSASEIHQSLILSLMSLIIPLVTLAIICVPDSDPKQVNGRGPRILCLACSIATVDAILLIYVCSQLAVVTGEMGFD